MGQLTLINDTGLRNKLISYITIISHLPFCFCIMHDDEYIMIFRKVLVHGSAEATEHLKQHCLKHVCPHVYAPQIEETIDVTSDLCAYKVQ